MDKSTFIQLLSESESEVIEFKEAKNNYDFSKLGKYFAALSNEANLCSKACAWLLFGVEDKNRKIIGTNYRNNRKDLDNLKKEIADKTTNRITFIEIFEFLMPEGRVLVFQIPAAPRNIPIAFEGHYYGREGESLSPLNLEELDRIRGQQNKLDWSAVVVQGATLKDLDSKAGVYQKIRNLKYLFLQDDSLFPIEMLRYEPFCIRELLNNAIAHQDYTQVARINVVEYENDHLIFSNYGSFIPKSVENVVLKDVPEEYYRNPFLVDAMKNMGMIETQGGGIRKIFNFQTKRFFPIPDYDFSDGKVKVRITAKILDPVFADILRHTPNLLLQDILILDKVQKKGSISDSEFKYLKKMKFIEGRKSNIYLSFKVVQSTLNQGVKAQYINHKSFDDDYFKKIILEYLKKFNNASRKDFEALLIPKLSTTLTEVQKKSKVGNLLSMLRLENKIIAGAKKQWYLSEV